MEERAVLVVVTVTCEEPLKELWCEVPVFHWSSPK